MSLSREVITIGVGQCGIQITENVWSQYCAEHLIRTDGTVEQKDEYHQFNTFFESTGTGTFVPRTLMVDLERNVIDDIKISKYEGIFRDEFLIHGKEDAANNFARGHYTVGKEIMDNVNNKIRKLVECCDNLEGFILVHSIGGGTGSGLGSLILERLHVEHRKALKFGYEIFPSPTLSTSTVEPYNALLTMHWLLDHVDISIPIDNEQMYEICQKRLDIALPDYKDINRLIAN
eukprot:95295_1